MGEPVRIIDLARLMIELSGLSVADDDNPDGEIAIEEIGLRPGEKLIEELLIGGDCQGTVHPRIVKARESMLSWPALETQLHKLTDALKDADSEAAISILRELVPEFRSPVEETRLATADVRELQSPRGPQRGRGRLSSSGAPPGVVHYLRCNRRCLFDLCAFSVGCTRNARLVSPSSIARGSRCAGARPDSSNAFSR